MTIMALEENHLANNLVWLKNGREALDFLFAEGEYAGRDSDQYPRIILLDLKMPKIDGLEVLRTVRNDKRTKHVPIAMLTSSREEKDLIDSYELGVNSYIVKPVDFDQFAKSVKDIGFYWAIINEVPGRN